ncbi:hypothetical protein SAMN05216464_104377 [Mucilaginibacter pineti]|uniref:Uncharacterized protein n=1 Tax=Mucilaginibacter pineti TaxID=1391627 RepID=A0A1G7B2U3_9SPHI|nr:hypothetical protein [Mucilaginibacter pineti]SDE21353.1 hypothetical protein SAMN05216464_104377 [Mucilaginibacter pineti]
MKKRKKNLANFTTTSTVLQEQFTSESQRSRQAFWGSLSDGEKTKILLFDELKNSFGLDEKFKSLEFPLDDE